MYVYNNTICKRAHKLETELGTGGFKGRRRRRRNDLNVLLMCEILRK